MAIRSLPTRIHLVAGLLAIAFLGACAGTPESRIEDNQAAFDAAPPEIQARILRGDVGLGMTEEQVLLAVGKPDEISTELDERGETTVWAWTRSRPGLSLGLGGFGGGGVGIGGGVGVGTGGSTRVLRTIEFREGVVTRARTFAD